MGRLCASTHSCTRRQMTSVFGCKNNPICRGLHARVPGAAGQGEGRDRPQPHLCAGQSVQRRRWVQRKRVCRTHVEELRRGESSARMRPAGLPAWPCAHSVLCRSATSLSCACPPTPARRRSDGVRRVLPLAGGEPEADAHQLPLPAAHLPVRLRLPADAGGGLCGLLGLRLSPRPRALPRRRPRAPARRQQPARRPGGGRRGGARCACSPALALACMHTASPCCAVLRAPHASCLPAHRHGCKRSGDWAGCRGGAGAAAGAGWQATPQELERGGGGVS